MLSRRRQPPELIPRWPGRRCYFKRRIGPANGEGSRIDYRKEARTSYLEFNQRDKNSPYNNVNLRKAISATIDRNALVDKILGDGSVVATGLIPEGMSYSPTDDTDFADENKNC